MSPLTVWDLVVARAARNPQAPAVRQWDEQLSYRELVRTAAALGAHLRELGVRPESRVGICSQRGVLLPAMVLGVLASGGAYVALDPAHPRRRLADMIADAGIDVVLADKHGRALLDGLGLTVVGPDNPRAAAETEPEPCPAGPDNLAYTLFTSGSTGRPKGVAVEHRSVTAFVTMATEHFGLAADCRSLAFSALGFDVSVLDMIAPLTAGGCVQLTSDADRTDPARLQRFLERHEVTWGFIPPALLPLLEPDRVPMLREVITAGEPPGPEQVARWSAPPGRRLHNWYGPTEATVCVVGTELTGEWDRPVPIGRPLAGCRAYVLDERLRPCAAGVAGELYLGGPQVARGYLGRPALTAERFVPDPFAGTYPPAAPGPGAPETPGARMFRTGDLARWVDDRIELLGRLDRQVKIHGQRVEIGEVEAAVLRHPAVRQAAVATAGGNGGPAELIAFLSPRTAPDHADLREHCGRLLPGYMVPSRVHRMDALPLNAAGKTDLAALRRLAEESRPAPEAEPAGNGSVDVARLWAEVLLDPDPGPEHDFLVVGGNSLRAMRLVSRLRSALRRDITVDDIYAARTLGALTRALASADALGEDARIRTGNPPALSPAQRRMWFVEHLAPDTPAHNIPMVQRLHGPLEFDTLRAALRAVAERHRALRWRVPERDGVPYVVDDVAEPELALVDLVGRPPAALRKLIDAEAFTRFDLPAGPLWRTTVAKLGPRDHALVITAHHIVFDGWSQEVLYADLSTAYAALLAGEQPRWEPLPVQFGDYVAELARRAERNGRAHLEWWTDRLTGAPTVCDVPRDRARPAAQTFRGRAHRGVVDAATARAVKALAQRLGTTAHAVLLSAFGQLLWRMSGQPDLIVGIPYADRDDAAFEPLIGNLLQILPVRLRLTDEESFAAQVRRCADEVSAAIAHRDAPLDRIVDALRVPRDLTRNPLIQVLFNTYEQPETGLRLPGCTAEPMDAGLPGALFDLTLYVNEDADGWRLQMVSNPDLYDAERVAAYLDSYLHLLRQLASAPEDPVTAASARAGETSGWGEALPAVQAPGLLERVTAVAEKCPDSVAVTGAGGELTYREFARLRDRVAAAVVEAGCAAGDTVAVLAARQVVLPAVLLGVLSTGTRWAVLDAGLPAGRIAAQAAAAGAKWLLSMTGAAPGELADLPLIELGSGEAPSPSAPESFPPATPSPSAPESFPPATPSPSAPESERGYLSFTSGTTGEPQVVVSGEGPLAVFLAWYSETFGFGGDDRFALLAGLAHDPLLRDAFTPLTSGARLAVPAQDLLRDPARLLPWLRDERITVAHLTPQLARMLAGGEPGARLPDLRLVAVAGDQLSGADAAMLRRLAPDARLINFYGATETPQAHAWYEIPPGFSGEVVPVGQGFASSQLLVLDRRDRPAAVGELGEVVVRGHRLSAGYLDAARTAERFIDVPGSPGERYYRTGDLGRYRSDGSVVLAGRADDQVKVRGFRVELGEVEAVLGAHDDVRAVAALAVGDSGEKSIRAFVAPAQPDVSTDGLLAYLRERLPEYAVPASLTLVPAIPLTRNGKVDRPALLAASAPRHGSGQARAADQELRTPTERLVAACWRSALGRARIGAEENFFEVGGHSLALVTVAARLSSALSREIGVIEAFRYPTIRALAAYLDGGDSDPGLDRAARRVAVRRARTRRSSTPAPTGRRRP